MRGSTPKCFIFAVLCLAAITCLGTLPAADKPAGKSKPKSKSGATSIKSLDIDVEKKRTSLFKDFIEIAAQYEDAGHFDRAKVVLEDLFRLDPKWPGLKEKIDELEDKNFDTNEVKLDFSVNSGWTPTGLNVTKGKPVRVEVVGEYEFRFNAKLTADGLTSEEAGQDYFDGIPIGALMAVVVNNGKSGKAVNLKAKNLWVPAEDGQVMLKINAPTGHKSAGKLTVKLSGLARTE